MIFRFQNRSRRISVDAVSTRWARIALRQMVAQFFPETVSADWILVEPVEVATQEALKSS
jgi:hypothetical protein